LKAIFFLSENRRRAFRGANLDFMALLGAAFFAVGIFIPPGPFEPVFYEMQSTCHEG